MRIVIFTSNAIRHKFFANSFVNSRDNLLVVSECRPSDAVADSAVAATPLQAHFHARYRTEKQFFGQHMVFQGQVFPIPPEEANAESTMAVVKEFNPELGLVFGASILRPQMLSLLPAGRFINMHLGLSPYYRGAGTNFWPFVNRELEFVGSTLLHIDPGIDTGDIIAHVRPQFAEGDTVHSAGNKVIRDSVAKLKEIVETVRSGKELGRVPQWKEPGARLYRKRDFNEQALEQYQKNLKGGLIAEHLAKAPKELRIIG